MGTGDTAFSNVTGSPAIVAASGRAPRVRFADGTPRQLTWWPLPAAPVSVYAIRMYLSLEELPASGDGEICATRNSGAQWSLRAVSTGALRLRDDVAGTVRWTSTAGIITTGIVYRVEITVAAGSALVRLYEGDGTTPLWSSTAAAVPSEINEVRIGTATATIPAGLAYGDIAVADTDAWIGPAVAPLPAPVLGTPTITDTTLPGANDGQISLPFTAGSGPAPAGFQRCILPGHVTSGFVEQGSATSPRVWTGLAPGDYTIAIKSKA
ncbi:MAG: hypothetical protein IPJ61_17520 [Tessaracoccus sp.]|uniref:hypothetical protein n=1 Tax=Tessaracoccus sp. TaxID=1971211 RepID=UPI001ED13EBC|nr:hypothetical protein [Tessaracoccus sp.]MBK7822806.1 hypothetical protein [Tessaracoccus sp.]